MKLIYNGVDLATLGEMRILQTATAREPAEAPQWERVTLRVRIDLFEQSYLDNASLLEQIRSALKTQHAQLLWQDASGGEYLNRTVTAGEDETDEDAGARGGTYHQALNLRFNYVNHDVAGNCLSATVQTSEDASGSDVLTLGTVVEWKEKVQQSRWDPMRDPRKLSQGTVTAGGRLLGDPTADLSSRRTALLAAKDALRAMLGTTAAVILKFATFSQSVRIAEFQVDVDQPHNYLTWTLTGTYTSYPEETDYALIELKVSQRQQNGEGIARLNLSGRIQGPTEAATQARLTLLLGATVPNGYVQEQQDTDAHQAVSESGAAGDGAAFMELTFNYEYRDAAGILMTWTRAGAGDVPTVDLGTVDRFADRWQTTLFDDLRNNRRRVAGTVTFAGHWFVDEALTDEDRQAALLAKKAELESELGQGMTGQLQYGASGAVFDQEVRLMDFSAEVNRLKRWIEWSLTANFTRFPNESDYALCDIKLGTRELKEEGTVLVTLNGRIGAPTAVAARDKLSRLRTQLVPAGYVLRHEDNVETRVDSESNRATPALPQGDGQDFIELTFNDEWQKASANVLNWTLRIMTEDDVQTAKVRTVYAGTVNATGSTLADAYATAAAKASALGESKLPFPLRSVITQTQRQFLTSGNVFVVVEFSYEYQGKGTRIYLEVTAELQEETFGSRVEAVNGFVAGPTLALAESAYTANVRDADSYVGALLLNERKTTVAEAQLLSAGLVDLASLEERFAFSFQVLRPKETISVQYSVEPLSNFQTMELITVVTGTVRASTKAIAESFLETLLGAMTLGKRVESSRPAEYRQGPKVTGSGTVEVFEGLRFTERYLQLLTGLNGLIEVEVTEDVVYSGDRLQEKPLPDGVSIIQRCGIVPARRSVSARAVATTESVARTWVKKQRDNLLSDAATRYENPAQITTKFAFLPQTDGVARGTGANPRLYEAVGMFSELLPELAIT